MSESAAGRMPRRVGVCSAVGLTLSLAGFVLLAGCANPGPPQPPTLKLPEVVEARTLSAVRVGGEVHVSWTTPTHTTDKLLIKGQVTGVLCREVVGAAGKAVRMKTAAVCATPVARVAVAPGPSDAVDVLPAELASGPVRLLAYRVELLNAAGRTAGPSPVVYAVAGEGEPAAADFRGRVTKDGVVLEWTKLANAAATVELTRTTLVAPLSAAAKAAAAVGTNPALPVVDAPEKVKQPPQVRLAAGDVDAGGVVDRSAQIGYTYRYTAERVRKVTINGQTMEVRSAPTPALEFAVRDVFAPSVPSGLVTAPAFVGDHAAIDLSWEPDVEARVAGYRVYRREGTGAWQRLTELVPTSAYRDATVVAGRRYTYRVTAVSTAGNESAAGNEVEETAPQGQ